MGMIPVSVATEEKCSRQCDNAYFVSGNRSSSKTQCRKNKVKVFHVGSSISEQTWFSIFNNSSFFMKRQKLVACQF